MFYSIRLLPHMELRHRQPKYQTSFFAFHELLLIDYQSRNPKKTLFLNLVLRKLFAVGNYCGAHAAMPLKLVLRLLKLMCS
jgi:hypothetical protein